MYTIKKKKKRKNLQFFTIIGPNTGLLNVVMMYKRFRNSFERKINSIFFSLLVE